MATVTGRVRRAIRCLGAIAFLAPATTDGQVLRGRVVLRDSEAPVTGAIVSLVADSVRLWPALTGSDGSFEVRGSRGGTFLVRVDRAGWAPFVQTIPLVLGDGEQATRTIRVPGVRAELSTVRVTASGECAAAGIRGADAAQVWDQARAALDVAALSNASGLVPLEMSLSDRIEPTALGRRVGMRVAASRNVRVWRTRSTRAFLAVGNRDFARQGFRDVIGDSTEYYGPDADVVLSPGFLTAHCFRVVRSRGLFGIGRRVGLAFAPLHRAEHTFLRGTLWLDEKTAKLDGIEYAFVVPGWPESVPAASGTVHFATVAGGAWILRDYTMTLPISGTVENDSSSRTVHAATYERVGRARVLRRASDAPLAPAIITGQLLDSVALEPLRGATILAFGDSVAVSDSGGRFSLRAQLASPDGATVPLRFRHPRLDLYDESSAGMAIDVRVADSVGVVWATQPALRVIEGRCREVLLTGLLEKWGSDTLGAVGGHVPAAAAANGGVWEAGVWMVEGKWRFTRGADTFEQSVSTPVRADGQFLVCPVANDRSVVLTLRKAGRSVAIMVLEASATRVRYVPFVLPPDPATP